MARPHETHEGMTRPGESGFTMVELLLVVVVLGILAAVVVANLGGVSSRATVSACQTDLKTVETAAGIYNTETGGTPVVTASLLTAGPTPYLQSWPSNPGYAITISGGDVYVQTAADSSPVRGTDPSACAGASTPAVATASASVVTLPVNGTDTSSAGANTATLEGNAVAASSGPLGAGSISFPGATGSYIRTTTQVTSPSTFSLSAWFDTTSSGPVATECTLVSPLMLHSSRSCSARQVPDLPFACHRQPLSEAQSDARLHASPGLQLNPGSPNGRG